jgi:melibiose permease/lactose/raffinose/galactose permease
LGYDAGGALLPVLAVVFALSTILTQSFYPKLTSIMTRKTLIHVSFGLLLVGYGLFYLLGSFGTLALIPVQPIFLIPIGFLIFSGQSIFYVTLMVMLSNTVEFNELKTGQRNESVIYSLRPLTAKIAASIQSGFVYLFLLISGVFSVTSQISSLENDRNNGLLTGAEVVELANALIQEFQNTYDWGLTIFKSGMILVPMVLFGVAYWILNHRVNLDEKTYNKILKELKQKKQPN